MRAAERSQPPPLSGVGGEETTVVPARWSVQGAGLHTPLAPLQSGGVYELHLGAEVKLVNPSGLARGDRRVKNDYRDCKELLDRMRLHKLPEAWIAPPPVRELRELVRYRFTLVCLRTGLKAQVKAVLAKHGLHSPVNSRSDE